jgi:hypothetical protein
MPDPFAPRHCSDCGKELTYKALEASDFLYGGGSVGTGNNLADKIAECMEEEPKLRARGESPRDDAAIVDLAVSWMLDFIEPAAFAAAVRHFGHVGDPDGSECERTAAAKWCHARDAALASGTSEEWARSLCNLEAGHEGAHSFEAVAAS